MWTLNTDYVHTVTFSSVSKCVVSNFVSLTLCPHGNVFTACNCLSRQEFHLSRLLITVYFSPDGVITCHRVLLKCPLLIIIK